MRVVETEGQRAARQANSARRVVWALRETVLLPGDYGGDEHDEAHSRVVTHADPAQAVAGVVAGWRRGESPDVKKFLPG